MRIRSYHTGDLPTLMYIQHMAVLKDATSTLSEADFERLLAQPAMRGGYHVFLITDDDDELNTWGQGESLDGLEGEVVGYTILELSRSQDSYHFHCYGAVLPEQRQRGAGHALLLCALNHARMQAINILGLARQQGIPIYFDVLLSEHDPMTRHLVDIFELDAVDEASPKGLRLYRIEL